MKHRLLDRIPLAASLTLCVLVAAAAHSEAPVGSEPRGFHGMLVVGAETIYMSHLPMFRLQHRYQGLWEVSFEKNDPDDADESELYRRLRTLPENAGEIFTLAPRELFRLPELASDDIPRSSFKADLFLGHFERNGRLLIPDVTVNVERRIHWHPFRPSHERPEELTYVMFGDGEEVYLSHWISEVPSYHQILAVAPTSEIGEIPESALFAVPRRGDREPLKAGESVSGFMILNGDPEQPAVVKEIELEVKSQFFLEVDELSDSTL